MGGFFFFGQWLWLSLDVGVGWWVGGMGSGGIGHVIDLLSGVIVGYGHGTNVFDPVY